MIDNNYRFELEVSPMQSDVFFTTFGNNTRLELKNSMFDKGKLAILLQKLDDNNRQTAVITVYLDMAKALVMANDILSGRFARQAGDGSKIVTVFKDMGGRPAEKANRADGKPLYREFNIQKGRLWIFKGSSGPGKVTDTGGFAADGLPETQVSVGMDDGTLKAIALMIQNEYQAFRMSKFYITMCQPTNDGYYGN